MAPSPHCQPPHRGEAVEAVGLVPVLVAPPRGDSCCSAPRLAWAASPRPFQYAIPVPVLVAKSSDDPLALGLFVYRGKTPPDTTPPELGLELALLVRDKMLGELPPAATERV